MHTFKPAYLITLLNISNKKPLTLSFHLKRIRKSLPCLDGI